MPLDSPEAYDRAIARATAAKRPDAVEELQQEKNQLFGGGGVSPTGETGGQGMSLKQRLDDDANAIGYGVTRAFTTDMLGAPGDARELLRAGTSKVFGPTAGNAAATAFSFLPGGGLPTSDQLDAMLPHTLKYEGKSPEAPYLGTTANMAANVIGPGGPLRKAAMVVAPGVLSEAAGQATEGTDWEPWARLAGALTGGVGAGAFPAWRNVDQRAISKLLQELQASGMTPQQAAQRLRELGPEGMLGDVNPGMQAVTGATGIVDPGATTTITSRLQGRREGGGPQNSPGAQARTRGALDRAMGPYRDPWDVQEANADARGAISPEYEAAIANAPQLPRSLDDLIAQGATPAMRRAADTLGGMSRPSRQTMATYFEQIDDALGADTPSQTASRLHDIRMGLDAQLRGNPLTNADRAARRALQNVRQIIDDILKDNVPGWREADEAFAPIENQREAFDQGRTEVLRTGPSTMTPGQLRHTYRGSTPEVNQSRTQGIRSELERQTDNERQNPALTVDRTLGRDFNQEKVGIQIGPTRADRLAHELDREGTFLETSNLGEAGRNSRTAPLQGTAQRVWGRGAGTGVVSDMLTAAGGGAAGGGFLGAVGAASSVAIRQLIEGSIGRLSRPAAAVIQRTADNLTTTDPRRRSALVQALIDEAARVPRGAQTQERTEALVRVLLSAGGGAQNAGFNEQPAATP